MFRQLDAIARKLRDVLWAIKVGALSIVTGYILLWSLGALISGGGSGRFLMLGAWLGFLAAVTGWGRKLRRPGRR